MLSRACERLEGSGQSFDNCQLRTFEHSRDRRPHPATAMAQNLLAPSPMENTEIEHVYEVRPRKDQRSGDLI